MLENQKKRIRNLFYKEGFALVGFLNKADCNFGSWISAWLDHRYHAGMTWMEKNGPVRSDPSLIQPDTKSIISAAYHYKTKPPLDWAEQNPISNYAWGEDYHTVIRRKLKTVLKEIQCMIPGVQGRVFVDTAPLPEKMIAAASGLGWIGKNSMLINRKLGSYLFLGEIVTNLDLASSPSVRGYCGTCRKCMEACPTGAIVSEGMIDSNRCLSYLTIEKKGGFSDDESNLIDYQLFGCDICQQVCPWNQKAPFSNFEPFTCSEKWVGINLTDENAMTFETYEQLKIKSPIKRTRYEGFLRNIRAVARKNDRK